MRGGLNVNYLQKRRLDKLFITLCETYHSKVYKYLYYAIGNSEEAKDLTQDTFTIIYNKISLLDTHPNQGGFIFQTAKNVVSNAKRKAQKKSSMEQTLYEDPVGRYKDIDEELDTIYDSKINEEDYIPEVLAYIPEDEQLLYTLHYLEGKSYKEIAKLLHIKEPALRMRYVRLRREIKSIIHRLAKENF